MKIMRHLSPLDKSVTCMKQANFGQTPVWCPILPNKLESFFSFHIGWAPIGLPFSVEMCIVLTTEANSLACIFHYKTFFKKLLSSIFALPYFMLNAKREHLAVQWKSQNINMFMSFKTIVLIQNVIWSYIFYIVFE